MTHSKWFMAPVAGVALLSAAWMFSGLGDAPNTAHAAEPQNSDLQSLQPVEDDMHEFMEYVFQPTYRRLKPNMSSLSDNSGAWPAIKSDALILAEGGNLLLIRGPQEDASAWRKHSVAVRDFGGKLYRAAKNKDAQAAQQNYVSMVENCNNCHRQFAGGEHILTP